MGRFLEGGDVSTFSRVCSFSDDSKIRGHILRVRFLVLRWVPWGCCYFFKGVGSRSGGFLFLYGSDGAGFCVFCGGFSSSGSF